MTHTRKPWQTRSSSYPLGRIFTEDELGQDMLTATQHLKTKLFKARQGLLDT